MVFFNESSRRTENQEKNDADGFLPTIIIVLFTDFSASQNFSEITSDHRASDYFVVGMDIR